MVVLVGVAVKVGGIVGNVVNVGVGVRITSVSVAVGVRIGSAVWVTAAEGVIVGSNSGVAGGTPVFVATPIAVPTVGVTVCASAATVGVNELPSTTSVGRLVSV